MTGEIRWRRLWQPRSGLFWQMLAFNLFSSLCAWALRSLPLNGAGVLLVGVLGLANCGFGLWAAWRLLQGPDQASGPSSASTANTSDRNSR